MFLPLSIDFMEICAIILIVAGVVQWLVRDLAKVETWVRLPSLAPMLELLAPFVRQTIFLVNMVFSSSKVVISNYENNRRMFRIPLQFKRKDYK